MDIPEKIPAITLYQQALNAYNPDVYPAHKKITAEEWNALMLSLFAQGNRQENYLEQIINDHLPDFIETVNKAIDVLEDHEHGKVDKEAGKGLSTNDLTNTLKTAYDEAVNKKHTHSNKAILDSTNVAFTTTLKTGYDDAVNKKHEHSNKAVLDSTNAAFTTTLKTGYDDANTKKHTHSNKTTLDATTASYTTDEKSKLATLENSHFRGQYLSKTALASAVPSGNVGDYAYVDSGAGFLVQKYLWDSSDNVWVHATSEGGEETPASIKHKYESNPDTNAYTNAEKTKVADALVTTGDIKDTVTTFTEAGTRENIATGEKTATLFGKIKKWFTDLKPHAFANLSTVYDIVIKTQAEFEALIADPTWFDATSVAFVGQFTLSTPDNSGVKRPANVTRIDGYNNAKITVTNFVHNSSTARGGLWDDANINNPHCYINDLTVDCTGSGSRGFYGNNNTYANCTGTASGTGTGYGFYGNNSTYTNCTGSGSTGFSGNNNSYTNCTGSGTTGFRGDNNTYANCTGSGSTGSSTAYGFYGNNNTYANCTGTGSGSRGTGYGFYGNNSTYTNCTGSGTGYGLSNAGYGFSGNNNSYTNCTGTGSGTGSSTNAYGTAYGFSGNNNSYTNCTGTASGTGYGIAYGFNGDNNSYANCTGSGSGTAIGYGIAYGFYGNNNTYANCTGSGSRGTGYGFYGNNSTYTNCTGSGTGTGSSTSAYGFYGNNNRIISCTALAYVSTNGVPSDTNCVPIYNASTAANLFMIIRDCKFPQINKTGYQQGTTWCNIANNTTMVGSIKDNVYHSRFTVAPIKGENVVADNNSAVDITAI